MYPYYSRRRIGATAGADPKRDWLWPHCGTGRRPRGTTRAGMERRSSPVRLLGRSCSYTH